jgi:hypothetical protein
MAGLSLIKHCLKRIKTVIFGCFVDVEVIICVDKIYLGYLCEKSNDQLILMSPTACARNQHFHAYDIFSGIFPCGRHAS